jgi:hypothetical protein
VSATDAAAGPAVAALREQWRVLHARPLRRELEALAELFFLHRTFPDLITCAPCRAEYLAYLAAHPPDLFAHRDAYFNWTVSLHNHVNRKRGRPEVDPVTARRLTRRQMRGEPAGERLLLRFRDCPGDLVMLTTAVRDLHLAAPGRFEVYVAGHHPALWANNPNVTAARELDTDPPTEPPGYRVIDVGYPLVHRSNQLPYHFLHGYAQDLEAKLGVRIPLTAFRGDLHLSADERAESPVAGFDVTRHYWVLAAAGGKEDFTAKWAHPDHLQAVVDHFAAKGVTFVQVGQAGGYNAKLRGVVNLTGKTDHRALLRLIYHSQGVLTLVSYAMHAAAAVPAKAAALRPCVVLAGGREPAHWEQYPGHRYLDAVGTMNCCATGGCWRNKAYVPPGDKDTSLCERPVEVKGHRHRGIPLKVASCMDRIGPHQVIRAVESYYGEGGVLAYPSVPDKSPLTSYVTDKRRGFSRTAATP